MTLAFPPATPAVLLMERLQTTDWRKLRRQSQQIATTAILWTAAVILVSGRLLRGGLKNSIRFLAWLVDALQALDTWLSDSSQQPAAEASQPASAQQQVAAEANRMTTAELREYLGLRAKYSRSETIRRYNLKRLSELGV